MKLLAKFNILLIVVFGVGIGIAATQAHKFLERSAREQVLQQARLMMSAAGAMRTYTAKQIGPLLDWRTYHTNRFLAQAVPAYGATEVFNYLRATYPAYTYKEATLNPTNPRDRAVDWEADVIEAFRYDKSRKEQVGERNTPEGESLFLAHPIKVTPDCLSCHGMASRAPRSMIRVYGRDNGFDWKAGDTVAAQIVSVPVSIPAAIADHEFRTLLISLLSVFVAALILIDLGLVLIVIRPVRRLSAMADKISTGNLEVPELPVKGHDEVSDLARSFNRMYRSLLKAIQMLDSE
ncbi:MAG: c-type heme family protein [Terriglobia bacterium]